jgi:hypothetical protein
MNSLRMETEEAQAQNEELRARIKVLEQENLTKEQEITSLSHRNTLLEEEVDKLEKALQDAKSAADSGAAHSTELDALQRKLQLLEDEAEEADKNLRETNEKYVAVPATCPLHSPPAPLIACLQYPALYPLTTPAPRDDKTACLSCVPLLTRHPFAGFALPMSRPNTTNARLPPSRLSATPGRRSSRRLPTSTRRPRRSSTRLRRNSTICKFVVLSVVVWWL